MVSENTVLEKELVVNYFRKRHQEKLMYLIVGSWNTLFGYGLFAGLYGLLRNTFDYTVVLMISYIISIANNYLAYKFIVFKTRGNYFSEGLRFGLVYGAVYVINVGLLRLSAHLITINLLVMQAVFTVFVIIISYVGNKYFAFDFSLIKGKFVISKGQDPK